MASLQVATSTEFKIEKGVPRPRGGKGRVPRYPFGQMDVDDSFEVGVSLEKTVRAAASYYGLRHSMKFSVRKSDGGFRCWRIS